MPSKGFTPSIELAGNTAATVRALTDHVNGTAPGRSAELLREFAQERAAFAEKAGALNGTPIHPMRLVHELQGLLRDDMTLCLDMGSFHIWLARQILMTNGQQTLGVGLPWAIAASLVRPNEKVMSISGDGGFLFSAMELETAVLLKCVVN